MTPAIEEPPDPLLIRCRDCGQLLARRWQGGGLRILVLGAYVDREGRLTVECPACGRKSRVMRAA